MGKRNKNELKEYADITDLRQFIYKQMKSFEEGDITFQDAMVQISFLRQLIESYKVQAKFLDVSRHMGHDVTIPQIAGLLETATIVKS